MMIGKIGGINPLENIQGTRRTNETARYSSESDSIFVSEEARKMADAYYLKGIADETPDVRSDLVAQVKEKIKDPAYLSADVISSAADRIMADFGF